MLFYTNTEININIIIYYSSNFYIIYYSEIALPWPLSNRDAVIQISFAKDTVNNLLHIRAKSIPGVIPKYPDLVRIPNSLATWEVAQLPNKKLKIEYKKARMGLAHLMLFSAK